eukprot:19882-Heterococcus_DN1.PRE.4
MHSNVMEAALQHCEHNCLALQYLSVATQICAYNIQGNVLGSYRVTAEETDSSRSTASITAHCSSAFMRKGYDCTDAANMHARSTCNSTRFYMCIAANVYMALGQHNAT